MNKITIHDMERQPLCRYGRGCTHHEIDPLHRDKFWHPPVSLLNGDEFAISSSISAFEPNNGIAVDQLDTHFVCYECGLPTTKLENLQV